MAKIAPINKNHQSNLLDGECNKDIISRRDDRHEILAIRIIIASLSLLLLTWIFAVPPLQNPDEGAHYIKTCANPIVETSPRWGYGHYYDKNLAELSNLARSKEILRHSEAFSFREFFSSPIQPSGELHFYRHAVPNTILPYLAPHIVCKTFQALQAPYQYTFYAIRVAFAATFIALAWFASRLDRRLFLICSPLLFIPMVITQGAAMSADYFSISAALILSITTAKMIKSENVNHWVFAISIFLILNTKIVYVPFLAIIAVPLLRWRNYRTLRFLTPAVACSAVGLALQYYYQTAKTNAQRVLDNKDVNLERLLEAPLSFAEMLMSSLHAQWEFLLKGMIGSTGWTFNTVSPTMMWIATALLALWLIAAPATHSKPDRFQLGSISFATMLSVGSFFAIYLSMYLLWTHASSNLIQGVQGRYLLPILFFIAPFILSNYSEKISLKATGLMTICMASISVHFLISVVIPRYHSVP